MKDSNTKQLVFKAAETIGNEMLFKLDFDKLLDSFKCSFSEVGQNGEERLIKEEEFHREGLTPYG